MKERTFTEKQHDGRTPPPCPLSSLAQTRAPSRSRKGGRPRLVLNGRGKLSFSFLLFNPRLSSRSPATRAPAPRRLVAAAAEPLPPLGAEGGGGGRGLAGAARAALDAGVAALVSRKEGRAAAVGRAPGGGSLHPAAAPFTRPAAHPAPVALVRRALRRARVGHGQRPRLNARASTPEDPEGPPRVHAILLFFPSPRPRSRPSAPLLPWGGTARPARRPPPSTYYR